MKLIFQAVGVYCYFPDLEIEGDPTTTTIKQAMEQVRDQRSGFNFDDSGEGKLDLLSYMYSSSSCVPPNASQLPIPTGLRTLSNSLSTNPSDVWQYYRSVFGTVNTKDCEQPAKPCTNQFENCLEFKLRTPGQPSYNNYPLITDEENQELESFGVSIKAYCVTWRIIQVKLTPAALRKFLHAKLVALDLYERILKENAGKIIF